MFKQKFLITRLEDVVTLTMLSFREDNSFASGRKLSFAGQPTDEEVIAYGKKDDEDGEFEVIESVEGLDLTEGDIAIIENFQVEEVNINDDPRTTIDESIGNGESEETELSPLPSDPEEAE